MAEIFGISYGYLGGIFAAIAFFFIIFHIFRQGGWSRPQQEREEIEQERGLIKNTLKERGLQAKEKWNVKKLIKELKRLTENYQQVYSLMDSRQEPRTVSNVTLNPSELYRALIGLNHLLEKMKKEDVSIKAEESSFKNFLKWWPIINKEIGAWSYKAKEGQEIAMQRAIDGCKASFLKIDSLTLELGAELNQEEVLDETRRQQILKLYQEVSAEEGKAA